MLRMGLRKFDHISQGIRSLNWLRVSDRRYVNDAVMTFKCIRNLAPDYLSDKFTLRSQIATGNTRQSNDLNIPRGRLVTGQRSFAYRGAKLWNDLSDDFKCLTTAKAFKGHLIEQIFEILIM